MAASGGDDSTATVFVDGLRRSEYQWFDRELRRLGVKVEKLRGVHHDEADGFMRLADALCGLVRAGLEGEPTCAALISEAISNGVVRPLSP